MWEGWSREAPPIPIPGPALPTCAVHQIVSYLRYCGRGSRTAAMAGFDPKLPCGGDLRRRAKQSLRQGMSNGLCGHDRIVEGCRLSGSNPNNPYQMSAMHHSPQTRL